MNSDWHPLTAAQGAVVGALLAEPFPGRDELRRQVDAALARTIDIDGSFKVRTSGPTAPCRFRTPVYGRTADVDGAAIEVMLHVGDDGMLSEVEILRPDGNEVLGSVDPSKLALVILPAT